jgi:release factor glutamine methyltransferase
MRPLEVVRRGAAYLEGHGVASPAVDAELLMRAILGVDRASLATWHEDLTPRQAKAYGRALCRRCTGTPLQHLTGEEGFRRLILHVRPGVFVPRPETEVLVEVALEKIAPIPTPLVVDACTGTGAIALAIVDEHPGARVLGTDLTTDAIALARENAARLELGAEFLQGDLLEPLPPQLRGSLDLITCNPPYVPEDRREGLPAEVLADPEVAVFGGPPIYRRLFAQACGWLKPEGAVVVEIEESTAATIGALAGDAGLEEVTVRKDLNGRYRVVAARRP